MKIKIISRGEKRGIKTAQIVIHLGKRSVTIHVWQRRGNEYGDWAGNKFELPN